MNTATQKEYVKLANAPDIQGLTFRRFLGEVDFPVMLAIIDGSKEADGIERTDTLEAITRNYEQLHNCDPFLDVLFAEVKGDVIGYNRVFWEELDDGTRLYNLFGFLLPKWRRQGIGRTMLRHAENRLMEIAKDHPESGPKYFHSWAADTEISTAKLLESEGYQPSRHFFEMVRDLNQPIEIRPMPDGLELRQVDPDHLWPIFNAMNEAFRDHWGHRDATEVEFRQWMKDPNFNPQHWQVAWEGDQVAGMVMNIINEGENKEYNRQRGYTENVSVRRPWRKRGLARALLTHSFRYLKQLGMNEAALGVDTENLSGALNLYKSVGFQVVKQHTDYRKPMQ